MGTRALDPRSWLVLDRQRDAQLALKVQLLDEHRPLVFGALPGSEVASEELLELVRGTLAAQGVATPRAIDDHPLIQAASMVQEDLVVLERIEGSWILTAGGVGFPTPRTGANKLGLSPPRLPQPPAPYPGELRGGGGRFPHRPPGGH